LCRLDIGILACIICYSGAATLTIFTTAYLYYLNKRNEARRVAAGKSAKLIDYSMTSAVNEKDGVCSPEGSNIGKRAFEDLTDLENDEFIVSGRLCSIPANVLTGCWVQVCFVTIPHGYGIGSPPFSFVSGLPFNPAAPYIVSIVMTVLDLW
jgi:hypothetical protein